MMRILDIVGILAALVSAIFAVVIMVRWPPGRDPRPIAPILALALAFIVLKLHPVMGWLDAYNETRDLAWRLWHITVFANLIIFTYLYGRRRTNEGVGGACAATRGRKLR